jgi:hypothetical protein
LPSSPTSTSTGSAFEAYLAADPKLLALSEPILDAAITDLIRCDVRFVLISGDLTKDGELTSHLKLIPHLQRLERAGIQVYVVPGNHDINNHDAVAFHGDAATPVPSVNAAQFRALYHRFGYDQAIAHAPDSLSYLAEPAPGLWLLALDSTKSAESATALHPIVSGRLTDATLAWAVGKIQAAHARGKKIVAMMHHGVNPHFLAEPQIFGDYLVDNWPVVGATFAGAGLKVVFTGHYHSQDAAWMIDATGTPLPGTLCDIETGSLVQWPCAYRVVEMDRAGLLHIDSPRVTAIHANLGGVPFPTYAEQFLRSLLPYQVTYEVKALFNVDDATAAAVAPMVVDALVANYAGDENPSTETLMTLQALQGMPEPYFTLGQLLGTLWIDPTPGDNTLVVPVSN